MVRIISILSRGHRLLLISPTLSTPWPQPQHWHRQVSLVLPPHHPLTIHDRPSRAACKVDSQTVVGGPPPSWLLHAELQAGGSKTPDSRLSLPAGVPGDGAADCRAVHCTLQERHHPPRRAIPGCRRAAAAGSGHPLVDPSLAPRETLKIASGTRLAQPRWPPPTGLGLGDLIQLPPTNEGDEEEDGYLAIGIWKPMHVVVWAAASTGEADAGLRSSPSSSQCDGMPGSRGSALPKVACIAEPRAVWVGGLPWPVSGLSSATLGGRDDGSQEIAACPNVG